MTDLQRPNRYAKLADLGELFTLNRKDASARCVLRIHEFGWELRLQVGELLLSHVCRSQDELQMTGEQWKTGMIEDGWRPPGPRSSLSSKHLIASRKSWRVDR